MADEELTSGHFKEGFMWGTATASYQIEGAWDHADKGANVWDTHTHTPDIIEDGSNGDIACNSFNKYKVDVDMIKKLNSTHYRFSLSWSRLLPQGDASAPSKVGVEYYNNLIGCLLENNVQPCVTLYHWDLPQCLQDNGGWQSDDIIEKFKEYAGFCFKTFGDRVKMWITINEPHVNCAFGFGSGSHAPGIKDPLNAVYQVSRTMLLSHASAYRLYDAEYRATQHGIISITLNSDWSEPQDPSNPEHVKAANMYLQSTLGWFAHPVFIDGDYPPEMKEAVSKYSKEMGLETSRLPTFTEKEKALIKGSHDFFGLNHYTTRLVAPVTAETTSKLLHPDLRVFVHVNPEWERAGSVWLFMVPWGLRKLLNHVKNTYGNPKVIITENGCSTKHTPENPGDPKNLEDEQRCRYIRSYINQALLAYKEDGVDLCGYYLWSLMDNFEWQAGYTERFGLHYVDFEDPERSRTPRKSAQVYAGIAKENGFK